MPNYDQEIPNTTNTEISKPLTDSLLYTHLFTRIDVVVKDLLWGCLKCGTVVQNRSKHYESYHPADNNKMRADTASLRINIPRLGIHSEAPLPSPEAPHGDEHKAAGYRDRVEAPEPIERILEGSFKDHIDEAIAILADHEAEKYRYGTTHPVQSQTKLIAALVHLGIAQNMKGN